MGSGSRLPATSIRVVRAVAVSYGELVVRSGEERGQVTRAAKLVANAGEQQSQRIGAPGRSSKVIRERSTADGGPAIPSATRGSATGTSI